MQSDKGWQYRLSALTIDEMEIKKHLDIDRKSGKPVGFVDIGCGSLSDDSQPQATKVLMLVAVGVNGHWKLPLGYWLTDGATAELQQSILTTALRMLYDVGNVAVAVTADGAPCNIKAFESLGAHLKGDNIVSYFLHPCDDSIKVAVFLDACHMIKLVRNLLAEYKVLKIPTHGLVMWKHIEELHNLQEAEGMSLANRLSKTHLQYQTQKMKVKLAAQLLSSSVANALCYLRWKNYATFTDAEPTEYFISCIDRLFDILNSRSIMATGYKKPFSQATAFRVVKFLQDMKVMLSSLEDSSGKKVVLTQRRTCIIGLIADIDSVLLLYEQLVLNGCNNVKLTYMLTYKFSQDHVELLFGLVRRRGGNNNNPTALQFHCTYRAILSHIGVLPLSNGNVTQLDDTDLLEVCPQVKHVSNTIRANCPVGLETSDLLLEVEEIEDVFDEDDLLNVHDLPSLSEYGQNVSCYVAGYVVRKLLQRLKCDECRQQLYVCTVNKKKADMLLFLSIRNNGGLIIPSDAVISVVLCAEQCIRQVCAEGNTKLSFVYCCSKLEQRVLSSVNIAKLFDVAHMHDTCEGIDNHVFSLIRQIVRMYVKVRKYHVVKQWNILMKGRNVRQMLTKTVLFKNQ